MRSLTICIVLTLSAGALACPRGLQRRDAAQVLADHRAALAAGNVPLAMCDFDDDAVVIHDGGVDTGKAAIFASLSFLNALFGATNPDVIEEVDVSVLNEHTEMARVLWSLRLPFGTIPDGVDTYIIRHGKIQAQTAHGFLVFGP